MLNLAPAPARATVAGLYLGTAAMLALSLASAVLGASYLVCPILEWSSRGSSRLCHDDHYKYLIPLLVPVTAWFAIANWVGWEYFRNT